MSVGPTSAACLRPRAILVLVAMVGAIALPRPDLRAQTVDYGALEKLFAEPVTTSATGSPQRASEVPADMEIVTADDISRSGAIDIPGVLGHVAGVDVLQWTNDAADVSVRGYNQPYSSRLLVLIDGRQVYADYYGFTPWSTLPVQLDAIRQIEIVKGPNSALFGFNAVGGVINIITSSPLYDDVNSVSFRVGTQGLVEGSVVSTLKLGDRVGIRIEAGGRSNDEFVAKSEPLGSNNLRGNDRGSIDLDGLFQLDDDLQLGLEASHTRSDVTEMFPTFYELDYAHYRADSVKAQLTADTRFGLAQATAYANWIHADAVTSSGSGLLTLGLPTGSVMLAGAPFRIPFNDEATVLQLQDLFKLGSDHMVRLSTEYRRTSTGTTPTEGGKVSYDVISGGGMWDWKITPSLSLTNALRIDYLELGRSGDLPPGTPFTNASWNRSLAEPSYNSGLVWQPDDVDTFRLTASRGVQLPNLEDLGAVQGDVRTPVFAAVIVGVPNLSPTIVSDYEIGWDRALTGIDATIRVSLFVQDTVDAVSNIGLLSFLPTGALITSTNIGNSRAEGIELELKGRIAPAWHWGLSYTPEIVTDDFISNLITRLLRVDYQHTIPTHVVKANFGWSAGRWEADAYLRYESAFHGLAPAGTSPGLIRIDDYVSIDGRVAYRLTDWATLALSGQNLGQSSQRQTAGPDVQRRVVGTLSARF